MQFFCFVNTRLIRTPHYYGQFSLSLGKENSYIFSKLNPLNTDTFFGPLSFCINRVLLYCKTLHYGHQLDTDSSLFRTVFFVPGKRDKEKKIIFPSLCYEDALKKSGLILLCQRREDACITFLKRSYSSSDLLRSLVPRVAHTRPYALRTGESVSVPASSRTNRFGNFCTIKYQNHV